MLRSWWTVLVAALVCGGLWEACARAADRSVPSLPQGFQLRTYEDQSGPHQYLIFVPEQYDASRQWPVVLFLHGAGEKGTDGLLPLIGGLPAALQNWPNAPFVGVFPQCEDTNGRSLTGWLAGSPDADRALRILAEVERDFAIDPQRRILSGWSMGGYGAWSLACASPEHWSGVLALSGGALPGSLSLDALAQSQTPVWAIHGADDALIPAEQTRRLVSRLKELGGDATATIVEGMGHDVWRSVFAKPAVFRWMLHPENDPEKITFDDVIPLPRQSQFARDHLLSVGMVPQVLGVRMGNHALGELAPELPQLVPEDKLAGRLPDIVKTFGPADDPYHVTLSDLTYRCELSECSIRAISGGRLAASFGFHPLELTIGHSRLDSRLHQAQANEITISIGVHRPAVLQLEVQPQMVDGQLQLVPLRQEFAFDSGNWYVKPPEKIQVKSDQFSARDINSGIVGTLYTSRDEIVRQVMQVVPDVLDSVEDNLQVQDAPGLAKLLSPLPVLVPTLQVSPAAVRTDPEGISAVLDLRVLTRGQPQTYWPDETATLDTLAHRDELAVDISLDAITQISRFSVVQDSARVNVLDISESKFDRLTDPKVMREILPDLPAETDSLRVVLHLLSPLTVSGSEHSSAEETTVQLATDSAALDIWRHDDAGHLLPVGRIVFSMMQPVVISSVNAANKRDDERLMIRWKDESRVTFVRGETFDGAKPVEVNGPMFEKTFRDAWLDWGQAHGSSSLSLDVAQLGDLHVLLDRFGITGRHLNLTFEASPTLQ